MTVPFFIHIYVSNASRKKNDKTSAAKVYIRALNRRFTYKSILFAVISSMLYKSLMGTFDSVLSGL